MWRLRKWMKETGTTQKALAARVPVSQPTVSDWLNNNIDPTIDNLRRLSEITGLTIDDLVAKWEEPEPLVKPREATAP